MIWPDDYYRIRGEIQSVISKNGLTARDLVTVFHGMAWETAGEGEYGVTFAQARDKAHGVTYPWSYSLVPGGADPILPPEPCDDGEPIPPQPVPSFQVGLHDEPGADYMISIGMKGIALAHTIVRERAVTLDFSRHQSQGIGVYLRVNWGYAQAGTIPGPTYMDGNKILSIHDWCRFVANTINTSTGLAGVIVTNEVNNPTEWPGGYPNPTYFITPEYFIDAYNEICAQVHVSTPMTPGAVDPYNVVAGQFNVTNNPRDWALYAYQNATRVDFIALHAKTQTSDLRECDPDTPQGSATFTDWPLVGRYMNLRTIEDQLSWIPPSLQDIPIIITELNPQRRSSDGQLGWDANGADWVHGATDYVRRLSNGAIYYRFEHAGDQEGFGLERRPAILQAIQEESHG